jgi:alanine racemase
LAGSGGAVQARIAAPTGTLRDSSPGQNHAAHAWLEIDAGAFEANVRALQSRLSPGPKLCAVLKADAYGHGVALLAPSVVKLGIEWVGITSNDEARLLRAAGSRGDRRVAAKDSAGAYRAEFGRHEPARP